MQVLMDTSDRKELRDAMKAHIAKTENKKSMYCP